MRRVVAAHVPAAGECVELDDEASHHVLRVIRLPRGATIRVTDGRGAAAEAVLDDVRGTRAVLRVVAPVLVVAAPRRVVLLGMPKGPLLDEALTLATEAGATEVRLVRARRSPPGEAKLDRLDRVVRAAVTQCGRAAVPDLRAPTSWADALDGCPEARWLADADGDDAPRPTTSPLALAVGPEGGLDAEERALLVGAGFLPVRLGPHTLRSPTAVAAALAAGFRSFE